MATFGVAFYQSNLSTPKSDEQQNAQEMMNCHVSDKCDDYLLSKICAL
jgi:hypothetical protein